MKSVDPALLTHLEGDTLTLAACWRITRFYDGKEFFYTDHDRPIIYPPVTGDTYNTANGFTRSAMKATADLSSQGMTVVGVFDDNEISDTDLIKGLFDNATIRMFLVNYADLSQGILRMKYGRFGEVQRQSRGGFQVELVDLTQKLNQKHDERRQPTCRARLGDERCNNADLGLPSTERNPVPIVVAERQDSTDYVEGDVIKVKTGPDPTSLPVSNIVNPGFETGDLTGWTTGNGFAVQQDISEPLFLPRSGSWMLRGQSSQTVDLRDTPGFIEGNVDAGLVSAQRLSVWQAEYEEAPNQDLGRVQYTAVDGAGSDISTLFDSGFISDAGPNPTANWHEQFWSGPLPVGTRQIRVDLTGQIGGGSLRVYFDDLSMVLADSGQVAGSSFAYEDRIYRCTVAGTTAASAPVYDTTIGNPTVDGTATFVAELSYMQAGEVQTPTDQRNFTALGTLWTDPLYDSPWFAYGGLVWETGANTDWVSEVRSADPPAFNLKFKTPFPIGAGDKFRVYPGCDLLLGTCISKWVHNPATAGKGNKDNFRGEAHLAGLDAGTQYPDAQS